CALPIFLSRPVFQILHNVKGLVYRLVGFHSLNVGHRTDAAVVMLKPGVVKPLKCSFFIHFSTSFHTKTEGNGTVIRPHCPLLDHFSLVLFYISPSPLSMAADMAFSASSSSTPSQIRLISVPHLMPAAITLRTLLAMMRFSPHSIITSDLNRIAVWERTPAGLKCSPEGFTT